MRDAGAAPTSAEGRRGLAAALAVAVASGGVVSGWAAASGSVVVAVPAVLLMVGALVVLIRDGAKNTVRTRDLLRISGAEALRRELDRARRHRRTFAIIRLPIAEQLRLLDDATDGVADATLRALGTMLRVTDWAWVNDGAVLVLLPEADRAMATAFLDRARQVAPDRFSGPAGIALFPDDGVTSGALLDAAENDQLGREMPRPMTPSVASGPAAGEPADAHDRLPVESEIG
jgi:uncharacterized membrane protein